MKPETLITDPSAAATAGSHLDQLASLANVDPVLSSAAVKFQLEHAAAKAEFEHAMDGFRPGRRTHSTPTSPVSASGPAMPRRGSPECCADPVLLERQHLDGALRRMLDFALLCGRHALGTAIKAHAGAGGDSMRSSGSVDDLAGPSEGLATVAHLSAEILSHVFLVSAPLRPALQLHALEHTELLAHLRAALAINRDVELSSFAEGFKTGHMSALANFACGCREVCDAASADEQLLPLVLNATRIDEENPGMVEWAEFCIRNLCSESATAREVLRSVTPAGKVSQAQAQQAGAEARAQAAIHAGAVEL